MIPAKSIIIDSSHINKNMEISYPESVMIIIIDRDIVYYRSWAEKHYPIVIIKELRIIYTYTTKV